MKRVRTIKQIEYETLTRFERFKIRFTLMVRQFRKSWIVFTQNRLAIIGVILIIIFGIMAILHPILINTVWPSGRYDPVTGFDMEVIHPSLPSARHLLGTDGLGRDVLSMLLAAAKPTFILGFTAAIVTAIVGTMVATVSAYFVGAVDVILTHITDAFLLLPAPLFMVIVGVTFRDIGAVKLGLIYGVIAGLGGTGVILRSHALTVMAKPYISATRLAGGGPAHIIFRHLIPHMMPLAATLMMMSVTGAVVADAFISFFGITRLYLNWGTMIYTSQAYTLVLGSSIEWHTLLPPSMAISLFAAAFYLISRGLHEVADPQLRQR